MGTKNHGIVHSAITRQLLEKKLRKQISAVSLGGAVGDLKELTDKVNSVQSSLSTISGAIALLSQQVSLFQGITDGLEDSLTDLTEVVNSLIESALTKVSYVLVEGGEGILSYTLDEHEQDIWEIQNPFSSNDIIVQVVDEANGDEIVGVSVEIEQEKLTLYLAHCEVKGQYRVILMG